MDNKVKITTITEVEGHIDVYSEAIPSNVNVTYFNECGVYEGYVVTYSYIDKNKLNEHSG